MAQERAKLAGYLVAAHDQPLIAIPVEENGRAVTYSFVDEEAFRGVFPRTTEDASSLVGAGSDLDRDEMNEALDRIRHESAPTPLSIPSTRGSDPVMVGSSVLRSTEERAERFMRDTKARDTGAGAGAPAPAGPAETPPPDVDPVIAMLEEWIADESGYDEEAWPAPKEALDREREIVGAGKLFRDQGRVARQRPPRHAGPPPSEPCDRGMVGGGETWRHRRPSL